MVHGRPGGGDEGARTPERQAKAARRTKPRGKQSSRAPLTARVVHAPAGSRYSWTSNLKSVFKDLEGRELHVDP